MPASQVSLALFAPLVAKDDKALDVASLLGAGYDLIQAEHETIQWFGVKYTGHTTPTYAIFNTFHTEAGRGAHLKGVAAQALAANAPTLLVSEPQIVHLAVLANKVVVGNSKERTAGLGVGLRVFIHAKPEKVDDVRAFLKSAVPLVEAEEFTPVWYAVEFPGRNTFAIIDFFADDAGREAHLNGKVAAALFANADTLLSSPPEVIKFEVVAAIVKV